MSQRAVVALLLSVLALAAHAAPPAATRNSAALAHQQPHAAGRGGAAVGDNNTTAAPRLHARSAQARDADNIYDAHKGNASAGDDNINGMQTQTRGRARASRANNVSKGDGKREDANRWWILDRETMGYIPLRVSSTRSSCTAYTDDSCPSGDRVKRGPDWEWGDQDGDGLYGTVTGVDQGVSSGRWCRVTWDNGNSNNMYRVGEDGAHDLCLVSASGSAGSAPAGSDSCMFARDGECDEPVLCGRGTDTSDCSSGVGSHCANALLHSGMQYATLDATSRDSRAAGCQDTYLPLPAGWEIAPQDAGAIAVTGAHPWGTHLLVYADGGQRYTNNTDYASQAGETRTWHCCSDGPTALGTSGAQYKVNACARRILIRAPAGICTDAGAPPPPDEAAGDELASGGGGDGGGCAWTNDGECDEPDMCPYGTDTADCGSGSGSGSGSGGGGVSWTDIVCPILIVVVLGMGYYVWKNHRAKQASIHEREARAGPDPEASLRSDIAQIIFDLTRPPARPSPVYQPEPSLQTPSYGETGRGEGGASDTQGNVSRECVVCMNAPRTTMLRPCGHVCVCSECAEAVSTCPLCRQSIADRIRAFL